MYDIVFLGCLFPQEDTTDILHNSIGNVQNAANLLQWDYIKGLEEAVGDSVMVMTCPSVGVYPYGYRKAFISTHVFHHKEGCNDISAGFCNIPIIRQLTYPFAVNHHLYVWAKRRSVGRKVLIAYSYTSSRAILSLKKRFPDILVILILPDLPQYTHMQHAGNLFYYMKKMYETSLLKKALAKSSGLAAITKQMISYLAPPVPSIVIEGMISDRLDISPASSQEVFNIAYTGTLTRAYGIMELVNGFQGLDGKKFRLTICGTGEVATEILKAAEKDCRICFHGQVSTDEARRNQSQAQLLVNPRKNDHEYIKYSFPSKILQYMSTGVPVLCYRLDGIPAEYDQYLLYIDKDESITEAIERVYRMPETERLRIGCAAREFVIREKNCVAQAQRLVDLIEKIEKQ